jgi:hypothetical protein
MITSQEQLVSKSDYDYEDFLRLLVSAADQLGVMVVSGFWARRKKHPLPVSIRRWLKQAVVF